MSVIRYGGTTLTLEDLLQGDVQLASPPEIFARLRRLLEEQDSTTGMLAEVIEHDPGLAARILKLANSAFFALPHKVDDIAEAVSIIGIRDIQDIVLATEVIQRFDNIPEDLVDIYSFWRHSLRCASLARQFSQLLPGGNSSGESLFLAGLLHDIGHLVIYSRVPELGRKALLEHRHRNIPLELAEREIMGFDYTEVGATLAQMWELPEMLCSVLQHQLDPEQAGSFRYECALINMARSISLLGSFDEKEVLAQLTAEPSALWHDAGLEPERIKGTLPDAEAAFGAALALLH